MQYRVYISLRSSLGSLVANMDIFFNVSLVAGWHMLTKKRENKINEKFWRVDLKRQKNDHKINKRFWK